jgi:hypothetical protein
MELLSTFEWAAVFCAAISGSIALNYESMARKHGFPIGSAFIGATKITGFAFASIGASVSFAFGYGIWWYSVLVFFAGMSIGAGLFILMFKETAQIISLIGMAVGGVMILVAFLGRPPIVL